MRDLTMSYADHTTDREKDVSAEKMTKRRNGRLWQVENTLFKLSADNTARLAYLDVPLGQNVCLWVGRFQLTAPAWGVTPLGKNVGSTTLIGRKVKFISMATTTRKSLDAKIDWFLMDQISEGKWTRFPMQKWCQSFNRCIQSKGAELIKFWDMGLQSIRGLFWRKAFHWLVHTIAASRCFFENHKK